MRYYKQRFGAERAVVLSHNKNAVGRVLRQYRALGWGGEGESHRSAPAEEETPSQKTDSALTQTCVRHFSICFYWVTMFSPLGVVKLDQAGS